MIHNITVGKEWVNLNTTTKIPKGTEVFVTNCSVGFARIQTSDTKPKDIGGVVLSTFQYPTSFATIKSEEDIWVVSEVGTIISIEEVK